MDQTLELVVKALTPPVGAALARPAARTHSATHSPKHPDKKALS
jgi:hypothetical protein